MNLTDTQIKDTMPFVEPEGDAEATYAPLRLYQGRRQRRDLKYGVVVHSGSIENMLAHVGVRHTIFTQRFGTQGRYQYKIYIRDTGRWPWLGERKAWRYVGSVTQSGPGTWELWGANVDSTPGQYPYRDYGTLERCVEAVVHGWLNNVDYVGERAR